MEQKLIEQTEVGDNRDTTMYPRASMSLDVAYAKAFENNVEYQKARDHDIEFARKMAKELA